MRPDANSWYFSLDHGQLCQVIETQTLWGETTCRVWLPGGDSVVRVPASRLSSLEDPKTFTPDGIAYVASAARVADALTRDLLLAPIDSSVIPLPHQIDALHRAVSGDHVRYLLADEVGLGKTIEAGLILRELKIRGLVDRILVIAPKGLVTQWVAEMSTHFQEDFRLLIPGDFSVYRRFAESENLWQNHSQVITSMDSVKPIEGRQGWSPRKVAEYNQERFEDLVSAGWDLIIVDEAHRLGGSSDQVARFKLGRALSEAAPYLLLLTATPHQGKTDSFHRLISLLDEQAFPEIGSIKRDRVKPYVIRTEKRQAITTEGKPLFKPRKTELAPVSWSSRHRDQRLLYEAVTEYVRGGYNRAIREKRNYIGFLMILMQRLVVSSTSAIRATLERRLEALEAPEEQLTLFPMYSEEEWAELDGQDQMDTLLTSRLTSLKNERAEVKVLLDAARRCQQLAQDAKADALLDWLYRLQAEERDPELKVLLFTEFVPTQEMLREFLEERGFSVVCLNGSMTMEERRKAELTFAEEARILISTDAGGEGLNLQFCHVVINYDIPWNPMRLEQRIGRVDRIGQDHVVRAVNFVFEDSVEHRVQEVLEEKLAVILEEFGIDKTGDVLDSAQAGQLFDELYVNSILNPDQVEGSVKTLVEKFKQQAQDAKSSSNIFGSPGKLDASEAQKVIAHPLPHWIERMTTSYLKSHGGKAERRDSRWNLTWPDGEESDRVVFSGKDATRNADSLHLTLESRRIRNLALKLPPFTPDHPIPIISMDELNRDITGTWSLWRIGIISSEFERHKIVPLFVSVGEEVFNATARHIWDALMNAEPDLHGNLEIDESRGQYLRLKQIAESYGRDAYDGLVREYRERVRKEEEKGEYAFSARRRLIERVGLPEVRNYRLRQLKQEQEEWNQVLNKKKDVCPEMVPLLITKVIPAEG